MENRSTVCPWLLTSVGPDRWSGQSGKEPVLGAPFLHPEPGQFLGSLFLLTQVTAQSLGSSMYSARMLMYWFASTPRVSWHIRHTAGASACYHDCELCPKSGRPANGGLSCMVETPRLQAGWARYERATMRFNKRTAACSAERVGSKWLRGRAG